MCLHSPKHPTIKSHYNCESIIEMVLEDLQPSLVPSNKDLKGL
ncbi:unnamed protein product, partial [Vitis vinifera]